MFFLNMCLYNIIYKKYEVFNVNQIYYLRFMWRGRSLYYLDGFYVFFYHLSWLTKTPVVEPTEEVVDSFRCWDDVERRRNSSSVLKVGNPKLTAGKLPLCVGLLLEQIKSKVLENDSLSLWIILDYWQTFGYQTLSLNYRI